MANVPSPAQTFPYPQTGSILSYQTGSATVNRTGVALSTMIIVKVGDNPVGAIQKLSISESRNIQMINEVGTDGNIDSAPTSSTTHTGSCSRIRFDGLRLFEAFGAGYLHIKSQRIPFDIEIIDNFLGTGNEIVTILNNVWFKDTNYEYNSDGWLITESANLAFETIYSRIGTKPAASTFPGTRSIPLRYDPYELAADSGARRGAMDAPGLLTATFLAA